MFLKIYKLIVLFLLSFFYISSGCFAAIDVVVSIAPQRYFVKKIAGDRVHVMVMVPPGYNPAVYEPAPSQMRYIEHAQVYFAIGVPFEKVWLRKFVSLNNKLVIVHTDANIKKRIIIFNLLKSKKHMLDPHIWLSPPLVKKQVKIMTDFLIKIDPEAKKIYLRNMYDFLRQIDNLDRQIFHILNKVKGAAFLVFHPCWGYFAERYGLNQIPIEIQGREPSGFWLFRLISYCKNNDIKAVFIQPQFSKKAAKIIADEIGAKLVIIDPLAEDWDKNLISVAKKIRDAISF